MISKLNTFAQDHRKELDRFLKFSAVGTLGAVIDFGTLNLLVQLASFPKALANVVSFTIAVISNFTWNRIWVYPETRGEPLIEQFFQFSVVNVVGLVINTAIFYGSDRWLLSEAGLFAGPIGVMAISVGMSHFDFAYNAAKFLATVLVLFWNFFANRVWTFGHVD